MADTGWSEHRRRRALVSSSVLALTVVLSAGGGGVGAEPDNVIIPVGVSVPSASPVADVTGASPSTSGDGRFIVFDGPRSPEDDLRTSTVFVTDRASGETTELSPVPAGIRTGDTVLPVVSGDGCTVVALSELQLDVFRDDDTGARWDVYRATLPHCGGTVGDWDLVSTRSGSGGIARDDVSVQAPTISRSGTRVAYTHPGDHLFEADGVTTISIVDLTVSVEDTLRSRYVAGSPADSAVDTFRHRGLDQPALSADGRFLAYRSDATSSEAVPGWAPGPADGEFGVSQVFVWDTTDADPFTAVSLVSSRQDGAPSSGAADPDISRDGTVIAFTSSDPDLVEAVFPDCETNCPSQVFVADRDVDDDGEIDDAERPSIKIISAVSDTDLPVAGLGPSFHPSLSGDGHLVAFVTRSTNLQLIELSSMGGGDDGDLLLAEIDSGELSRLSNTAGGVLPTAGVHAHPDLSDTGRTAVFDTAAASEMFDDVTEPGRRVVARSSMPELSLAAADLGTTQVGLRSDEWYVAVINNGPSSFEPSSVQVSDARFTINDTSPQNTCALAATVPAGGSCTVAVSFTPSGLGPVSGDLTVAEEGFGAVFVTAPISGAGGEPALRIDPGGADLGLVTVGGASTEFQFDLSNIGFAPTEVTGFEISGEHPSDFVFTSNSCALRPLNPRASCSVGVTFVPSDAGRRTALLVLGAIEGQYTTVVLAGDGEYEPVVELAAESVNAGDDVVARGTQYPANTDVTVVIGDTARNSFVVTTDDSGGFEVPVPIDLDTRGGASTVVVQSVSGAAASAPVEVVEDDAMFVGMPGFGLG